MADTTTSRRAQAGLGLVELLIVIAILGIAATIVFLSARGPSESGRAAECTTDLRTLRAAENVHFERFARYATEAELVDAKLLSEPSAHHHVEVAVDKRSYTVSSSGDCP